MERFVETELFVQFPVRAEMFGQVLWHHESRVLWQVQPPPADTSILCE